MVGNRQGLIGSTMVPVESIAREMLGVDPLIWAGWMNGKRFPHSQPWYQT